MNATLNADVGEVPAAVVDGSQDALLALVDLANVACGGHAGDDETMRATVAQCRAHGVLVGAHPSYPDRAGFGRTTLAIAHDDLARSLGEQVDALAAVLAERVVDPSGSPLARSSRTVSPSARAAPRSSPGSSRTALHHVKPHGALYHDVARDPSLARVLVEVMRVHAAGAAVVLVAGAATRALFVSAGIEVVDEGFADRAYAADGSLVPRSSPGALILDPQTAAEQATKLAARVQTLCVHGDTPGALALAAAVRAALR